MFIYRRKSAGEYTSGDTIGEYQGEQFTQTAKSATFSGVPTRSLVRQHLLTQGRTGENALMGIRFQLNHVGCKLIFEHDMTHVYMGCCPVHDIHSCHNPLSVPALYPFLISMLEMNTGHPQHIERTLRPYQLLPKTQGATSAILFTSESNTMSTNGPCLFLVCFTAILETTMCKV
jgi:hypothetical protein